ncbi:hypothetical protein Daura_50100 [Dactylosporangium aurantiacum]|uniref:Uncharacterized protein n=1 Tax=Dactylosporangium aurantiacum TaxID=35754 RepID=A0A9Q9IJF9_9ACTN|nr:hypothetical protein [Dactylosporangium aurantiacum]MDG6107370.1 hypothetical protein [Dactylosporangium aurantiacum]UWZ54499.1 hypothetical protein Daura_50100 [Dactylosporangium aurantiacum]
MTDTPLARLCAHRGVALPGDGQLLALAPVLRMRPADLLAIAGGSVPAEFVPADPDAKDVVESLLRNQLHRADLTAVRDHALALPAAGGPDDLPPLEPVTFGGVFSRLMQLRNLTVKGMAYATGSAMSTVAKARGGGVLSRERYELMAALLCLRADDVEAMVARETPGPPPGDWVRDQIPGLRAVGALLLALAPLRAEQIRAVSRFAG